MKWRELFRSVHRDMGYVLVALVLAYGLSGLAVNHIEDWNPSYTFDNRAVAIGPVPPGTLTEQQTFVVEKLAIPARDVRGHFQPNEHELRVFLEGGQEVHVDTQTGRNVKITWLECGNTARTTRKWIDAGKTPLCPCNHEPMTAT